MVTNFENPAQEPQKVPRKSAAKVMTEAELRVERERVTLADAVYQRMKQLNPQLRDFDDATFRQARNEVFTTNHVGSPGTKEERQAAFTRLTKPVKSRVIKLFHRDQQITLGLTKPQDKRAWLIDDARKLQGREQKRAGETYKSLGLVEPQDPDVFGDEDEEV